MVVEHEVSLTTVDVAWLPWDRIDATAIDNCVGAHIIQGERQP
jgi:hypothetical protein